MHDLYTGGFGEKHAQSIALPACFYRIQLQTPRFLLCSMGHVTAQVTNEQDRLEDNACPSSKEKGFEKGIVCRPNLVHI